MTTRWARLTWQVPDPALHARWLAARFGLETLEGGLVSGAWTLDLASALLEVRPWLAEGPADHPRPGGRLVLEAVPGGERSPEEADPLRGTPSPVRLAGIGWATVELDRAEAELGMWLGDPVAGRADADPHLGATARVRAAGGLPGDTVVLLEPRTEGRVAASLARDGEGPCALYLRPAVRGTPAWRGNPAARAHGSRLPADASAPAPPAARTTRRPGPLGTQVLLLDGPVAGPHVLLLSAARASPGTAAGTIRA